MLIGRLRGAAVIGAPGCARSPKENGFDWVLMRLLAGPKVTRAELTGMGVGARPSRPDGRALTSSMSLIGVKPA